MSTSNIESKPNESKLKTELKAYHKKTLEAFGKENLANDLPYELSTQKRRVDDFLRRAKEDKQPIQKIITYMKRIAKVVRDDIDGKAVKKDFLEVHSELRGIDWKDNPLRVTDYFDRIHYEPILITHTGDRDPETGDFKMIKEHQGNRLIHDLELTDRNRKQIIEEIINSATGTYKDDIKFYYVIPDSNKGRGLHNRI